MIPGKLWPAAGSYVVVETARGVEYGQVITGVRQVDDELIASPLKQVLRIATEGDARHAAENEAFEKEAYRICQHKIEEHKLDMKLVGVEQTFDNAKIPVLLYSERPCGFSLAGQGSGIGVSHPH